jgi:rod shape-determining protein MreB
MSIIPGDRVSSIAQDLAVDLGTANTLIYVREKGIVLNEPSYIAMNTRDNSIHAVGMEAKVMYGRAPRNIKVLRPIKDGVISDPDATNLMIKSYVGKVISKVRLFKPRFMICVPSGITQVEMRAVMDAAFQCGAGKVHLIEEPMSAAIGSGLPVDETRGFMVVDIGGGTTDVAVISMGSIASSESARVAGDEMDEAIVDYVRRDHQVLIGVLEAEEAKIKIGSAYPDANGETWSVKGRDLSMGTPKEVILTASQVAEAIEEPLEQILKIVRDVMDNTTPELHSDIYSRGIFLTGGGSLINGIDRFIQERIGVPVKKAHDPLTSVVKGAGRALEEFDRYKKSLVC